MDKDWDTFNTSAFSPEPTNNLTKEETTALKQLKNNPTIIIKPAGKGSAIVIWDTQQYILEVERQLQNTEFYQKIKGPIYLRSAALIKRELIQMERKNHIPKRQRDYLIGDTPTRSRCFYLLPKIHKDPSSWPLPFEVPLGRPIICFAVEAKHTASHNG